MFRKYVLFIEEHKFWKLLIKHKNSFEVTRCCLLCKMASSGLQKNVVLYNTSCYKWHWCRTVSLRFWWFLLVLFLRSEMVNRTLFHIIWQVVFANISARSEVFNPYKCNVISRINFINLKYLTVC